MKSIEQILHEAHYQIRLEHGISLEEVRFELINVSGAKGVDFAATHIEVNGKLISVGGEK